jgi:4a-hydroxytetrahydrobiopterin dehydratase
LRKNQISAELAQLKDWKLRGREISKRYVFEDFKQGIRVINRIAKIAEDMNHHPDIEIRYHTVRVTLTTHDEGGLTMKDFKLASKRDRIKS